jgi:hypothetical protein
MVLFAPIRVNDDFTAFSIHDEQPLDAANPSRVRLLFLGLLPRLAPIA